MSFAWHDFGAAWSGLPPEVRETMTEVGKQQWEQVFAGIASHNRQWRPLRPPMLQASTFQALHETADRVGELLLEACRRRAATAGELNDRLGLPPGRIRMLEPEELLSERLLVASRPDIVVSQGVPKFVEFNIDSALGGAFDSDKVAARFAALYESAGVGSQIGVVAAPSAVDGRFAAIREELKLLDGERVAMVMDLENGYPGTEDARNFLKLLTPVAVAAEQFGMRLVPFPVAWLTNDDQMRLLADGEVMDAVFRLFVPNKVPPGPGLDALGASARAGTVKVFTSSASWLLGNKIVLAWLWEDVDALPPAEAALVRMHVPHTVVLSPANLEDAFDRQHDLVLKPGDGSGGQEVLVGRESTVDTWRTRLAAAVASADGYVLQEYVVTDGLDMDYIHLETGEVVNASVPYCLGPYLFGRRQCGGEVRFGYPSGGSVMNLDRGALVSGILVTP